MTTIEQKFAKNYKTVVDDVDKKLSLLLKNRKPKSIYEPCSYILEGKGKRLRPFLVLVSAKTVGGSFSKVYNAAIAVEILHSFTLVHDDIMDNSDKRRGRVTLHKKYDLNTAILVGDNLNALAYESLLKDCKKNVNEIVSTFTQCIVEVCEGQSLDKEFEMRNDVTLKEYKVMIYKKTAALSEMCCKIGGLIVSGNKKEIIALSNYGKNLGMAFQIQDDLLDIIADENELGKITGSDLVEGKKTYLFLRAMQKAKGADKDLLLKIIDNNGIERSEIENYKNLYIRLGVLQDAKKEIERYTKLALNSLSVLPNNEGQQLMNWLANVLINRNK
ncbi:MAG: Geranylgeranyl pyrophosphate synthase [Ignavibacteria bacterium]|nr:MAG: Geranylgeranyl pyrophosphate synthase [Ignavibacteria bacterium]KAF0160337.1 MAG: Geranylgeranyl pyrophosphate synthase [Ignavibacteria bacterium]